MLPAKDKTRNSEFTEHLVEIFKVFGVVRARRMFGGVGLFHQDLMIGLVADDVLYLKADKESAATFTDRGLTPFEYVKNGKSMNMSYYLAPEEIFDEPEAAERWASLAYDAALRSRKPKRKPKKQKSK